MPIIRRYSRMYTTVGTYYSFSMTVSCPGWIGCSNPTRRTEAHHQEVRLYLPMMGPDAPETCSAWRNLLRISCASSWFFFTRLYQDAQSTNLKQISRFEQGTFQTSFAVSTSLCYELLISVSMWQNTVLKEIKFDLWSMKCYKKYGRIFRNVTTSLVVILQCNYITCRHFAM